MIVNFIIILLILFLGFNFSRNKNKDSDRNRKNYIISISILLILQSGLRHVAVGSDTYAYFEYFERDKHLEWSYIFQSFINVYVYGIGKEPGYILLEKGLASFFDSYQFFLFFIASFFFSSLGLFLYKNVKHLNDLLLAYVIYSVLFYSFYSITGHRQTIATSFILFAFEFLKKRKLLYFLIIVVLASTVHKSSLIFIPIYFFTNISKPLKIFWMIFLMFPLFFFLSGFLTQFIGSYVGDYEIYAHMEELKPTFFVVFMLLVAFLTLIKYKNVLVVNPESNFYIFPFMIGIFFLAFVFEIHGYMRVVQYFSIFLLVLIPLITRSFYDSPVKIRKLVYQIAFVTFVLLFIKYNINGAAYGFFWEQMSLGENYK